MLLVVGLLLMNRYWDENYGTAFGKNNFIPWNRDIVKIAILQTCVDTALNCFIIVWMPLVDSNSLDVMFTLMMCSCMVGSYSHRYISLGLALMIGSASLVAGQLYGHKELSFMGFQFAIGAYHPHIGAMRSRHVPEYVRSTMYSIMRIPMNILVVIIMTSD